MHRRALLRGTFIAAGAVALGVALTANATFTPVGTGKSWFTAQVSPGSVTINGEGSGVTAYEKDGNVVVKAPVNDLKTGISKRDEHLQDAINGDEHPNAYLTVKRSSLTLPADGKTLRGQVKGTFRLNGTNKVLPVEYEAKRTGPTYAVKGWSQIKLTDFNVQPPCWLGICVENDVKIYVNFTVKD